LESALDLEPTNLIKPRTIKPKNQQSRKLEQPQNQQVLVFFIFLLDLKLAGLAFKKLNSSSNIQEPENTSLNPHPLSSST
jgi:hypothetical protein